MSERTRGPHGNLRVPLDLPKLPEVAPAVYERMVEADQRVGESVEPVLLELARLRTAMILDPTNEGLQTNGIISPERLEALWSWEDSTAFSGLERACLAVVEQFVFYVADVDDALIADLREYLDAGEVYRFISSLNFVDATERLRVALDRLFDAEEAAQ